MIGKLNTKHGFEAWINHKLIEEIEGAFKGVLDTSKLNYYYIPCRCEKGLENEVKWLGRVGLIDFIKKVQKVDNHFCMIGVTNAPTKKDLMHFFDKEFNSNKDEIKYYDYWIGDSVHQDMVSKKGEIGYQYSHKSELLGLIQEGLEEEGVVIIRQFTDIETEQETPNGKMFIPIKNLYGLMLVEGLVMITPKDVVRDSFIRVQDGNQKSYINKTERYLDFPFYIE